MGAYNQPSSIVSRGDWLRKVAKIKDKNKGAAEYVGKSMTVHNDRLFFCSQIVTGKLMRSIVPY